MISRIAFVDNRVIHQSASTGGGRGNKVEERGRGKEDCRACIYIAELAHIITECADVKTKRFHDKLKWIYVEILSAPRRALSQRTHSQLSKRGQCAGQRLIFARRTEEGRSVKYAADGRKVLQTENICGSVASLRSDSKTHFDLFQMHANIMDNILF